MGTYMYVHVERRDGNGWKYVPCEEPETHPSDYCRDDFYRQEWYRSQCYQTMAVLCDVRNYDNVQPISDKLRMVPHDLSHGLWEVVKDQVDYGDIGCSWLMLSEIKSYDFDQPVQMWKGSWVDNTGVEHELVVSDRTILWHKGQKSVYCTSGEKSLQEQGYTPVQVPIRERVSDLFWMIERIERALPGVDPSDIRLTLYFSW